jgi:hypothetical protein
MTFQHVRESLSQLPNELDMDISSDFLDALQTEGEEVTVEINGLEDQLPALKRQVDALWEGEREYEYELVSVFMHRGESNHFVVCSLLSWASLVREDERCGSLLDVPGPFTRSWW